MNNTLFFLNNTDILNYLYPSELSLDAIPSGKSSAYFKPSSTSPSTDALLAVGCPLMHVDVCGVFDTSIENLEQVATCML